MKKAKTTKRAFVMSLCAMTLCCAMLIGSTFAWFTDSATSGKNKIIAGNLDVGLEVLVDGTYVDATTKEDLFKVALWEPGVVAYQTFKAVNNGNLALKYNMYISAANANTVTVNGEKKSLADVIKVAVIEGELAADTTREGIIEAVKSTLKPLGNATQIASGKLLPNNVTDNKGITDFTADEKVYTVVAYWEPTDVDNNYNLNNGKKADDNATALSIDFGVTLSATQVPYEKDSFGIDYDEKIPDKAVEAVTATINMGAKDANAAIVNAIKASPTQPADGTDITKLVYFDEAGLQEVGGEQAITLHFAKGSQDYVNVTYDAVKSLIGTAVNAQAGNIYSIKIAGRPVRILNGKPIDGGASGQWVEDDLRAQLAGVPGGLKGALEAAKENGLPVVITSMDGETQTYRMNFDLKW